MSEATALRYREHRPRPELRSEIECLWMAWSPKRRAGRPPEHVIPDACPELIVHLGDRFARRVGLRWRIQPRAFLAGTLTRPWTLRPGAAVSTLGIRFRPGAVRRFFPIDMSRAADREVPLASLAGPRAARALTSAVGAASVNAARFRAAEGWLLGCRAVRPAPPDDPTRRAIGAILRTRGRRRIDTVAAALGVTRRRLERRFARELGIRPKLFARIVRLNAALAALGRAERERAVDIALEAGYFDQAHLSRDFRAVAGRPASADRTRDGEMSRHFTDPDRILAYLAGE